MKRRGVHHAARRRCRGLAARGARAAIRAGDRDPSQRVRCRICPLPRRAHAVGQQIDFLRAGNEREIDSAFRAMVQHRTDALLVAHDPFLFGRREQVVTLTAYFRIPAIYEFREFVLAGGLMSYGSKLTDNYRLAGVYASRILKGTKPADLPVQQPTKFILPINLGTAKELGLTMPDNLLALADEVIE